MQIGPIQFLAFAFDRVDLLRGAIRRELDALRAHGLVRIIDLRFVMKEADGTLHALQESDLRAGEGAVFGALLDRMLGLGATDAESAYLGEMLDGMLTDERGQGLGLVELRAAAAALPPGTAAALLLVEHAWAVGFGTSVVDAGGRLVAQGFLTRDALLAVGRELNTIVEAEVAAERIAALRGAAMLDALTSLAAAEEVQQAAVAHVAATVAGVEAFRTVIAAEAVRALIVAGLLDEADAGEAVEVLIDAELIAAPALEDAISAADAALAELTAE